MSDAFDEFDDDALLSLDIDALAEAASQGNNASQDVIVPPQPPPLMPTGGVHRVASSPSDLTAALFRFFGHDEFREGQQEVIAKALAGSDVAVYWATGRGKSICYQLPALLTGRVVVVVSPLISLMADQVNKLNNTVGSGVRQVAAMLGSGQRDATIEGRALNGEFSLVYLSPEKLVGGSGYVLDRLAGLEAQGRLLMFAIDEAHCVSEWGHDFRPEFRQLGQLRQRMPAVPIMALTATAVPTVQEDISRALSLRAPFVARSTAFRRNLTINCLRKDSTAKDLRTIVTSLSEGVSAIQAPTIIYAPTKGVVESIYQFLSETYKREGRRVAVDFYHGSRSAEERERAHLSFLSGRVTVMVATVAFGMGIE